jgi:flagellar biosynthetic protein FliQ
MTPEYVIRLGQESLLLAMYVAGPALVVALVVGLLISVFQAVTQIHEMTLTFIPKILAVAGVTMVILPWIIQRMVDFTARLIASIPAVVG